MFDWSSVTAEDLLALPIEAALAGSDERECHAYSRVFRERARQSEDSDDAFAAGVWRMLADLADLHLHGSDRSEPFPPTAVFSGRRTMIPRDLSGEPAKAFHGLAQRVRDPELRARLLDVVWDANRDHRAAESAVSAYLESAQRLLDPEHWVAYYERCARALGLAVALRHDDLRAQVMSEINTTLADLNGEDPLFLTVRLVSLLLDCGLGDVETLSTISERGASIAEDRLAFDRARSHLENVVVCRRRLDDVDGERSARGRIAACFERQGMLQLDSGEYMAATHWLEKAHSAYRESPGMRGKAGDVYVQLRVAQREAAASMSTLDLPATDITELVEQAEAHVAGHGFFDALWWLFNILPTTDFVDAERHAAESLESNVYWRLASRVAVEPDGRVAARSIPPSFGDDAGVQSELWKHVVELVSMNHQYMGIAVIRPAVEQIMREHAPSYGDVHEFVSGNPLVPFGREGLFAKGLLSGLRGDMVDALSVLLPQFENGLRHLLGSIGVETSSMDKMGNQDVFQMGRIVGLPELERVLGSDLVKDLKVLFMDEHGHKIRDRMSHGLMSPADYYSGIAYYTWWQACRVCFHPVLRRHIQGAGDPDGVDR